VIRPSLLDSRAQVSNSTWHSTLNIIWPISFTWKLSKRVRVCRRRGASNKIVGTTECKKKTTIPCVCQLLNRIYKFWVQRVFLSHARVYAEPRASSCVPPQTITQNLPGRVACITIENWFRLVPFFFLHMIVLVLKLWWQIESNNLVKQCRTSNPQPTSVHQHNVYLWYPDSSCCSGDAVSKNVRMPWRS
jgi:hypothetical protein